MQIIKIKMNGSKHLLEVVSAKGKERNLLKSHYYFITTTTSLIIIDLKLESPANHVLSNLRRGLGGTCAVSLSSCDH
jgi:hypothetical protein